MPLTHRINRRALLGAAAVPLLLSMPRPALAADDGTAVLADWYRLVLELVRHTATYSPPVASRSFAYLGITLHEALVGGPGGLVSLAGQVQGLTALPKPPAGLDPALVLQGDFTEASGSAAIERLLDAGRGFSAVFAANDQMAFGAALALHRRGLHVPHDVSLVGFDDLASASFTVPPLTTVHHPVYELGQSAAQAMLQLLAGETPTLALSEPRLVVRESSVALAAQGPRGRR